MFRIFVQFCPCLSIFVHQQRRSVNESKRNNQSARAIHSAETMVVIDLLLAVLGCEWVGCGRVADVAARHVDEQRLSIAKTWVYHENILIGVD